MSGPWSPHLIETVRFEPWTAHHVADAHFRSDGGVAFSMVPRTLWEREATVLDDHTIPLRVGVLLLERPGVRIVVDTGLGGRGVARNIAGFFGGLTGGGGLGRALEELGWEPDSVTHVIVTHLHVDHAGGLFGDDERPLFPRARFVVSSRELGYALDPHPLRGPVYDSRAARLLAGSERLDPIGPLPREFLPDLEVSELGGHSPGQIGLVVRGAQDRLLVPGDVLPTRAHRRPRWVLSYDQDPSRVYELRRRLGHRAMALGSIVHFGHDPAVAFGRLKPGSSVEALPVEPRGRAVLD
jgi:glyoxylase-like metal-dependent hydrolase (beta-lactamase superfamily II)